VYAIVEDSKSNGSRKLLQLLIVIHHQNNVELALPSPAVPKSNMKTILSFKLFTATPVKSKLSSCHVLAVVTPIDSFRKQLLLLQTLKKFFPATGDQIL
jgi:hypothetical protein